jgi:Protein of unknown function (DUF1360)
MTGTTAVTDPLDDLERDYSPHERRPLRWYAVLVGANVAIVAGAVAHANRTRRLPERLPLGDLVLGAVATFKLSRLLTRSSVASPLRAPFTRFAGAAGPAELREDVRGDGLQHAVGELVTCPYCMAHWIATAYGLGLVYRPRSTRFVAGVLAVEAAAEQLQARAA